MNIFHRSAGASPGVVTHAVVAMIACVTMIGAIADERYDFRSGDAYEELSDLDREKLEKFRLDQTILWGALDMYADNHAGGLPDSLDDLVPSYLRELPSDPFANKNAPGNQNPGSYTPSKQGTGYLYRKGSPGNRAWVITSVGLPDFPYLAAEGNVGLYICKGTWISGWNPMSTR